MRQRVSKLHIACNFEYLGMDPGLGTICVHTEMLGIGLGMIEANYFTLVVST